MSHKLIDHNDDLRKLRNEGYNVDVYGAYLIVRDIPYVNAGREVRRDGVFVAVLNLNGDILNQPSDHTIKFMGEYPCAHDGQSITAIIAGADATQVTSALKTNFTFSAKPQVGNYANYYEKIRRYDAILSGPAAVIDSLATAKTYQVVEPEDDGSPFEYIDTADRRAHV